ncbi:MAG TPA: M56 family metallopeptidase [Tepidisphaeraceae bacterium]|jgi:parallel beta-helix repeat protein|nr:M56 family metallopeptidase [Tepidisphaeraceae bacterium]
MTLFPILTVTFIHTLWIGTLLGLGALATRLILHRAQPQLRYIAALAWLFLLACSPLLIAGYLSFNHHSTSPIQTVSSTPASFSARPAASPALTSSPPPIFTAEPFPIADHPINTWVSHRHTLTTLLPILWITGTALMLLWSLLGLAGAERLRKTASPPDPTLDQTLRALARRLSLRHVDLLLSPRITSPILIGILKPAILLPPALLTNLTPSQLELILLHELAHVRRLDNLINLLQRLIESLLFFHPAVWLVSSWARQEREHCCDDFVLKSADPHEYAAVLLTLTQSRLPFSMAATGSNLSARIRRILTRQDSMRLSRISLAILSLPIILSCVLLARAAVDSSKTITVAKTGGDYTSIQAAIDAAPPGATIHIAPGIWEEDIKITKPLTLEGSGWNQTTLSATVPAEARQAAKQLAQQADKGITIAEWTRQVNALTQKYALQSVIRVEGAQGVTIRDLTASSSAGANPNGSSNDMSLILFNHSAGKIENCAAVGSTGSGIQVAAGSDVQITHSLVAAVWGTGIVIGSRRGGHTKAVVSDSDIRNCYYTGIGIGPDTDVTVQSCRISGTAWHGIRYDSASPTITGNRIFDVARCGIYASGDTHATITNNLFLNNEMDGISCWFNNKDTITQNTFASNLREGLAVLGDSHPAVERNLFYNNPIAVELSAINGNDPAAVGAPILLSNWFWKNQAAMKKPAGKEMQAVDPAPETKSQFTQIQFKDPDHGDFALPDGSPLLAAKTGNANPLPESSPFPLQPEEKAIFPTPGSRDYQKWNHGQQ